LIQLTTNNSQPIKVFISYSSKDGRLAGILKHLIERYNLNAFLAHEDIQPTAEWRETIIHELKACDIFIPFITKQFSQSDWTDQETGMAIAWDKLIIPLRIDKNPYGFIGKFQALKVYRGYIKASISEILKVIKEHTKLTEPLKECLISALTNARDFDEVEAVISQLKEFKSFSKKQVNQIIQSAILNNQVRMCSGGKQFLESLMLANDSTISKKLKQEYQRVKDAF
jgi:hypothetical protein